MTVRHIRSVVVLLAGSVLVIVGVLGLRHAFSSGPERECFGRRDDPELLREIAQWKPGQAPPARLLLISRDIEIIAPICPRPWYNDGETLAAVTNKELL